MMFIYWILIGSRHSSRCIKTYSTVLELVIDAFMRDGLHPIDLQQAHIYLKPFCRHLDTRQLNSSQKGIYSTDIGYI